MARIVLLTGFFLMSLGALAQYGYPGMYNPFPVYLWEQELYRRQARYDAKIEAECLSIKDAWARTKPGTKIESGVYRVYGVNEDNSDWRAMDVVVIKNKIIQVGSQTLPDQTKISKGRAKAPLNYDNGGSDVWYFFFIST